MGTLKGARVMMLNATFINFKLYCRCTYKLIECMVDYGYQVQQHSNIIQKQERDGTNG